MARLDAELQQTQQISLADYEVLVHLSEADGHMLRMTELADRLLLSPSGLTRRVDRLVSSGLVERIRCPTDRRGILARLKTAGRKRLERAAPDHVDQVRRNFIDRLNRRQLASLVDALDEIVEDPVLSESRVPG
jgi:DNA-binding MarR family transcriptional regulator